MATLASPASSASSASHAPSTATLPGQTTSRTRRYLVAQAVGSFGLAAGGTSGGLLAADMAGHTAAGTLAIGSLTLGAALSAPLLALVMGRNGRRAGLAAGYAAAAGGALVVLIGAAADTLPLVVGGSAVLGAGNSAVMLTRYVVADAAVAIERGRAVSRSLVATVAGAIVGPNLLRPAAALATPLELPAEAGLYLVAVAAFVVAAGVLHREPAGPAVPETSDVSGLSALSSTRLASAVSGSPSAARVALVVLATANAAMVSMMALAAVHLDHHGHELGTIGLVVSVHVAGMFVGSPLVGWLCDRVGARWVALAGAVMLSLVGLGGAVPETGSVVTLGGVLLLLGVSWNLQVVAGTVMLTHAVPPSQRLATEGRGEMVMGLAAAAGTLLGASPLAVVGGFRLVSAAVAMLGATAAGNLARAWSLPLGRRPRRPTWPPQADGNGRRARRADPTSRADSGQGW